VHIAEYEKGSPAICLACGHALVARQGKQRQWHFAHLPPQPSDCNWETALHRATKLLIKQRFDEAIEHHQDYWIVWHCPGCGKGRVKDITRLATMASLEHDLSCGVRPDIYFHAREGYKGGFAIEIVVSHPVEAQTQDIYHSMNLPVFIVEPDWDMLPKLARRIDANSTLNMDIGKCPTCQRRAERQRKQGEWARRFQVDLDEKVTRSAQVSVAVPWYNDPQYYPKTRAKLKRQSEGLLRAGARQAITKPWLFIFETHKGVIFADLHGTDEVPIWEDESALIYWQLTGPEWQQRAAVRAVRRVCQNVGVKTRLSFYEMSEPDELFFGHNDH